MTERVKSGINISLNMLLSAAIGVLGFAFMQAIEWGSYKQKVDDHDKWITAEQQQFHEFAPQDDTYHRFTPNKDR